MLLWEQAASWKLENKLTPRNLTSASTLRHLRSNLCVIWNYHAAERKCKGSEWDEIKKKRGIYRRDRVLETAMYDKKQIVIYDMFKRPPLR